MSQDDSTARIESYLSTLRRLKETSARRDLLERELFLAVLLANDSRLLESPALDADRQNLTAAIAFRGEPHPAHAYYREWISRFLTALNQYEVATRTGADDQTPALAVEIVNAETLLAKCLQGYIILSGVVRDEFNDVLIMRFGESALADIDELTHAGYSDDRYWKALFDRFALGFVSRSYPELVSGESFRLSREGSFVAVRFPLDALTALMPGTDKEIDKTRLQHLFDATRSDPQQLKGAMAAAAMLAALETPLLPGRPARNDLELMGRVAAIDPLSKRFVEIFVDGQPLGEGELPDVPDAGNPDRRAALVEARKEFLKDQLVAMAAGAALAMCNLREDLGKAVQEFSPREQEKLLAVAGSFDPAGLALAHTLMLEFSLCKLLADKVSDEGAKVQVKCAKHRRALRAEVEALAAKGFNRVRQKVYFEDDPSSDKWLLFKARSTQELADTLGLSNMDPFLTKAVTALWNRMEFKAEALVLVNMALVSKATQNVQAKLAEIFSKLGVMKGA